MDNICGTGTLYLQPRLYANSDYLRYSQEDFCGQVVYSADFRSAKDLVGKKVVVIGACASGMLDDLNRLVHLS